MDLSNKIALVTGSGRGIGKAIALKLAEAGATVVVNDINDSVNSVVEEIKAIGKQSQGIIADVSSTVDVEKMMDTIKNNYGRLDILVNNAGIARDQIILRMTDDDWNSVMNINLKSVFLCTRAALRPMIRQRSGRIINMASIVGIVGNPGQANYASAKAGIIGFTRTIAKEVASRQITVNAIAPGFIDTEMTQKIPAAKQEEMKKAIPLGFLGTPRDIAETVAFLASDEARYITGQVLCVDGGLGCIGM